jgi:hypothetical protein
MEVFYMKFNKLMLSALAILGLTASVAQARHHRHHGPRVSFGFNVGRPMYQPAYVAAPCYGGYCAAAPVYVAAPVACTSCERPSFGVSFGSGPVSFGFGF